MQAMQVPVLGTVEKRKEEEELRIKMMMTKRRTRMRMPSMRQRIKKVGVMMRKKTESAEEGEWREV